MELSDYLAAEHGRAAKLADTIRVPRSRISEWSAKKSPIPLRYGPKIEAATSGEVCRKDLFPFDYLEIWPELAQASVHPAQAATQTIASTAEPAVVKIVCREAEGVVIGPEQRTHAPRQYQDPARDRRVHPDGVV